MDKRTALDSLRRTPDEAPLPPSGTGRRWRLPVAAAAVLLAVLATAGWWRWYPRPDLVQTAAVTAEGGVQAGSVLNASGTVVAQGQATVASQVTGMVTDVYIHEGDKVEKGQIIARLDSRAARASAAAAAGQLKSAQGQVAAYQALVERYASEVRRQRHLAAAGATSQANLEEAQAALKQNQGLVDTYRGEVEQYRSTLSYYDTQLAYTEIRAPFAGVVTERYAHPGEMISPQAVGGFTQTGICTIVDMSSLEVAVDVGEAFITRLYAGMRAEIVLDAYPDWRLSARVITIVPTANQQKATVKVRIAFDKLDPRILPQMSAQVWFDAAGAASEEAIAARLYAPKAAIRSDTSGAFVYRIDGDAVRKVSVRIAPSVRDKVRILSGLREGDRLVTSSERSLKNGQKVREQ